ncbi:hypothetical protein ACFRIC_17755 [Streptomyces sp. NPDC056738]|uniref:Rv1733c family protein n=1 Tax=Streptomyces sp. NPDC056738 TaxID=3345933 RepID=UPI00368A2B3E
MRTRVRGWRWRRNPLRRRSDVVEAWWALAVGVLLFVGAPLLGAGAAWWTYDGTQADAAARRAVQHHVRAVLMDDAPTTVSSRPVGGRRSLSALVRWTGSDGKARTGRVGVPAGLRRGARVDVWTDARERIVRPAPSSSMVLQQALATGVFATTGAASAVVFTHFCVRRALGRRRLAQWEHDWARTEPEWTRRTA